MIYNRINDQGFLGFWHSTLASLACPRPRARVAYQTAKELENQAEAGFLHCEFESSASLRTRTSFAEPVGKRQKMLPPLCVVETVENESRNLTSAW